MNSTRYYVRRWSSVWFWVVISSVASTFPASGTWQTKFDNSGSVAFLWSVLVGSPQPAAAWDPTVDQDTNPNSGSLKCSEPFTGVGDEFFIIPLLFLDSSNNPVVLDAANFVHLSFDLKVTADSAPSTNNSYGLLDVGFVSTNNPFGLGGLTGPQELPLSATNWRHFVFLVNPTTPGIDTVCGVKFTMFSRAGLPTYFTNSFSFNVDNLALYNTCCAPPEPFKLQIFGNSTEGYRLRWPTNWSNSVVESSSELTAWQDTGLDAQATVVGSMLEVALPNTASTSNAFWRLKAR